MYVFKIQMSIIFAWNISNKYLMNSQDLFVAFRNWPKETVIGLWPRGDPPTL